MESRTTAGRLLTIIEEGKKIPNHTNCSLAWEKLLNVPSNNKPLLFKRLGSVMMLPLKVEEIVLTTIDESQQKTYLKWLAPINNAFYGQNLSGNWDSFIQHIDQHTIDYLTLTRDILNMKKPEGSLKDEELKKLQDDFIEIEDEIIHSDIDPIFKEFVLKRIKDILNAIDEYEFNGIEPLMDTLNVTIGEIVSNNDLVINIQKSSLGKKIWSALTAASVLVTLAATDVTKIENNLSNLLPLIVTPSDIEKNSTDKEKDNDNIIDVKAIKDDEDT